MNYSKLSESESEDNWIVSSETLRESKSELEDEEEEEEEEVGREEEEEEEEEEGEEEEILEESRSGHRSIVLTESDEDVPIERGRSLRRENQPHLETPTLSPPHHRSKKRRRLMRCCISNYFLRNYHLIVHCSEG